jgi:hypothetical protein
MTDFVSDKDLAKARMQLASSGGNARAESLSADRRSAIARKAAKARWKKRKKSSVK